MVDCKTCKHSDPGHSPLCPEGGEEVDERVEKYKKLKPPMALHEWLGWTWEEYGIWLEGAKKLVEGSK